jgi:hypothetical protein
MTEQTLKRLIGGLVGLALLYFVVVGVTHLTRPRPAGSGVFGAMIERIRTDTINGVVITIPNRDTVGLRRGSSGWTVNGYHADSAKTDLLLRAIAEAQVGDLVSKSPATVDRLGVSDTAAWRVEIDGSRDTARFLIATAGSDAGNGYARLPSETNVYEVSAKLRAVLTNPEGDWRDKEMARVDSAAVQRITMIRDGATLEVQRSGNGWAVQNGRSANVDLARVALVLASLSPLNAIGFRPDTTAFSGKELREIIVQGARGDTLAAIDFAGHGQAWLARVRGKRQLYQVSSAMLDRLTPTRDELQPSTKGK